MQQFGEDVCYDSELFNSTQLEGLLCPIGLGVLRNPVFDQCGHVYCFGCINAWLKKSNLCPINKSPIIATQLIKAIPIKNMVDNLELKQCLQMCEWKGKLDQYYGHIEKECPEILVNCKNKECQEKIKRIDLSQHLNGCQYQEIQCEYCDKPFNQKSIEDHKLNCGEKIIECKDCQQKIKINDDIHASQCEFRLIQCPIEGCLDQNIRHNELGEHLKSSVHLILLQNSIKSLKQQVEQQKQQIDQNNQKQSIPYLQGWKLSHSKKIESREWLSINSLEKLPQYFSLSFEITGLQKRPNQWRCSVGINETQIANQHLWYRQKNSFVWILGGFKCSTQAEKYGKEVQEENIKGKIILNRQNELSFEMSGENLGVAFVIDDQLVNNRFYLMVSFINQGKIRFTGIDIL